MFTRAQIFGAMAMAVVVVVSNILVQYLLGNWLTYGAFTYPIAFLITDVINRIEGAKSARKVVFVGFIIGLMCPFIGAQIQGDFGPLVTLRVAMASGSAFLIAQLLDVFVFDKLRGRAWWTPPVFSSVIGSSIDTLIFFTIAFSATLVFLEPANDVSWANEVVPLLGFGTLAPLWISLALADYLVKLAIAMIALIPYRQAVKAIEA